MNTQKGDFLLNGLVGSPCSPRDSQESSPTPQFKSSILQHSAFFIVQLSYPYMTTGKTIVLTRQTFVDKITSLLFNMLSRLIITFLPGSKHLLISWLQSPSSVILEPPKIKSVTVSTVFPSICHEVMGPDAMILVFYMLSFMPTFSLSSFTFIKQLFSSSSLSAIRVVSSAYLRLLADQETTGGTGHGTTDWFQIGKGVRQGCIVSPCLFNFYAEYIMRNTGLEEAQAGIKISGRSINNLRYADDTTLMARSEEELKSLDENERGE